MAAIFWVVVVLVAAVWLLRGFDRISGRGPKQVSDGIGQSKAGRVPCPHCAEAILPAAKLCPHCRTPLA